MAAGAALLMLVLHLAVPMGYANHDEEANALGQDDEAVSRSDIAKGYGDADGYGPASPGVTLAGTIIALVAGMLLLVSSFAPVPVVAARFIGWTGGLLGALGAFMALTSSAYWVGLGFTTFLRAMFGWFGSNATAPLELWVISPVIVMGLGIAAFWGFLGIMANVIAKRDDLRSQAHHQLLGAKAAMLFLVAVLVLPWSLQVADGDDRREMGLCDGNEVCPAGYVFFSAFGHGGHEPASAGVLAPYGGILGIAEATENAEQPLFQGLAFSLKVMTAMGWIGFLLGALVTVGPLLSSAFKLPGAARFTPIVQALNLPMAAWAGIMFILAGAYMWNPSWDNAAFFGSLVKDQSWWFAFFPLVAAVPFTAFLLNQWQAVREVFGGMSIKTAAEADAHSFD